MVWAPGQSTPAHDHLTWCVVGVYEGVERETVYRTVDGRLVESAVTEHRRGDVVCYGVDAADIHRVENATERLAISIHVYGTNIAKLGSSIRRRYPREA